MKIETGYKTGLIADIVSMHARYYAEHAQFGASFESVVASGLADFTLRLDQQCNEIWHVSASGTISASIAIDGEDLGNNVAHLRWFIVDGALKGGGIGRKLLEAAVHFCHDQGFHKVDLWTFSGLNAARHLYETQGFKLVDETDGNQWGKTVREQKFQLVLKP